jgi:hypothetical protein
VFIGARDGALRAVHTDPTRLGASSNGTEAWAFIPRDVASRLCGDLTNGLVLYFGTGTADSMDPTEQNAFYAVHSASGAIRSVLDQRTAIPAGIKFTGGVAINDGQIVLGTGRDLASEGLCTPAGGQIIAVDAETFAVQLSIPTAAKILSPIFVRDGQYYTTDYKGRLQTSSYTGMSALRPDGSAPSSTSGTGSGASDNQTAATSTDRPSQVVSWAQRN